MTIHFKHTSGKLTAFFLLLIFVGPLITAHVLYAYREKINFKTTQIGTLFSPPIATAESTFSKDTLGKWQLIYVSRGEESGKRGDKGEDPNMLPILSQIHLGLGKEKHRVNFRIIDANDIPVLKAGQIAIIDPKGFIVLYYPRDCKPQGILKDLRQLLRVSHA